MAFMSVVILAPSKRQRIGKGNLNGRLRVGLSLLAGARCLGLFRPDEAKRLNDGCRDGQPAAPVPVAKLKAALDINPRALPRGSSQLRKRAPPCQDGEILLLLILAGDDGEFQERAAGGCGLDFRVLGESGGECAFDAVDHRYASAGSRIGFSLPIPHETPLAQLRWPETRSRVPL